MARVTGANIRETIEWRINKGRNGNDPPDNLLPHQTAESLNIVIGSSSPSSIGAKRNGCTAQAFTGDTVSGYNALANFIAGQSDAAAQLFIVDRTATTKILRVTGGTAATNLSLISAVDPTAPWNTSFAIVNGKLFIANKLGSAVDRLLVYDPGYSTSAIRYAGLVTPAAPTAADQGAGGPVATLRYYRVAWREKRGSVIVRQGEFGARVSRTNTAGSQTRVTKPAASSPAEGETHWALAASADGLIYYIIAETAVGTTTFDDALDPANYSNGTYPATPDEGSNTVWPSVKFIVSTGDRLVGFGAYQPGLAASIPGTMASKDGRVWFSPVLDSSVIHDEERVSNTLTFQGWIDVARNNGSEDRALCGPLDGQILAFQSRGQHLLVPTGDAQQPFERNTITTKLGAVNNQSTFIGEDEFGRQCVYFLDPKRGPYRYGAQGNQWCGYDVADLWETINLDASTIVAHGLYNDELRACMWWICTGSNTEPDTLLVFFVQEGRVVKSQDGDYSVRYGWVKWTGVVATERCSVMFAKTFGAAMSRATKPYVGGSANLLRADDATATLDNATTFQATVTSPAFRLDPIYANKAIGGQCTSYLMALAASGVTIRQSFIRNFGDETDRTSDVLLTAAGSETRVLRKFEDAALAEAYVFQVKLGDAAAISNAWSLDDWMAEVEITQDKR